MSNENDPLTRAFASAREKARAYAEEYNSCLPAQSCPRCGDVGHVPGLRCPACGYRHPKAWVIVRDTEWGYEVIALTNRRLVLADFPVEPHLR